MMASSATMFPINGIWAHSNTTVRARYRRWLRLLKDDRGIELLDHCVAVWFH